MCIRDRGVCAHAPCTFCCSGAKGSLHRAAGCLCARALVHSPMHAPVSYTHLTLPTICSV
eukprot:11331296-Alexandrium_andersonii.AAC.1